MIVNDDDFHCCVNDKSDKMVQMAMICIALSKPVLCYCIVANYVKQHVIIIFMDHHYTFIRIIIVKFILIINDSYAVALL